MNPSGRHWFAVFTDKRSPRRLEEFLKRKQFSGIIRNSCKPPPFTLKDGSKLSELSVVAIAVDDAPSFSTPIYFSVVSSIALVIFGGFAYFHFYLKRLKSGPTTKTFSDVRIRSRLPENKIKAVRWNFLDHIARLVYRWRKLGWVPFVVAGAAFLLANFTVCGLSMLIGFLAIFSGLVLVSRPISLMFRRRKGPVPDQDRIQRFVKYWLEYPQAPARDLGYVNCGAVYTTDFRILLPIIPYAVIQATIHNGSPFAQITTVTAKGKVITTHNNQQSTAQSAIGFPYQIVCVATADILKLGSTHVALLEQHFEKNKDDWVLFVAPSKVCLLYTSPSPRDATLSRMPSSA